MIFHRALSLLPLPWLRSFQLSHDSYSRRLDPDAVLSLHLCAAHFIAADTAVSRIYIGASWGMNTSVTVIMKTQSP